MHKISLLWVGVGLLVAGSAPAQDRTPSDSLTANRVVELARAHAPKVRMAESQVLEARGRLSGARSLGQENPTVEGVASRDDGFERRTQWELSVPIGIGLGRASRVGLAKAELEREQYGVEDARRGAGGQALSAYFRVLHAARRVDLARNRQVLAADLLEAASQRHRSGEAPRLEVLLTETEDARAQGQVLAEQQGLARSRVSLALALGLPSGEDLAVSGDLGDLSVLAPSLAQRESKPRSDVLAAQSELRAAQAARNLARTDLLPGLAFRMNYGHEDGDALTRAGLAVTVPLFQYGQESRQVARAREARATAQLQLLQNASTAEAGGFRKAYEAASAAAEQLESRALPRVKESEAMARESFRAGKIDLPALLIIRRDLLEARREHLDLLLEAALAGIDLAVANGNMK